MSRCCRTCAGAVNEANRKVDEQVQAKMGALTGGLKIPASSSVGRRGALRAFADTLQRVTRVLRDQRLGI